MGQHYHFELEKFQGALCINGPNLRRIIFNPLRFKKDKFLKELKLNKIKNGEFVGFANFYFIQVIKVLVIGGWDIPQPLVRGMSI